MWTFEVRSVRMRVTSVGVRSECWGPEVDFSLLGGGAGAQNVGVLECDESCCGDLVG